MMSCCWIGDGSDPPWRWDLRRRGWTLCRAELADHSACAEVHLLDARRLAQEERAGLGIYRPLPSAELPSGPHIRSPLIVLGVDDPMERARLLGQGCAEALPSDLALAELDARARRAVVFASLLPRKRVIGPLTLDLFHRDARLGKAWLGLHPREFGVLWRLADEPGHRVTRRELLRDVWRIHHEPETNSVEVHVSRLRSKLAGVGCEALVETASEGGYRLAWPAARPGIPGYTSETVPGNRANARVLFSLGTPERD